MRIFRFAPVLALLPLFGCEPSASSPVPDPNVSSTGSAPTSVPTAAATASTAPLADVPIEAGGDNQGVVAASNAFGLKLYQELRTLKTGNLAYSPASISVALAMTYAGAKGDTAKEMMATLALPDAADAVHGGWATVLSGWQKAADVELSVANRLFGEQSYTFEPAFLELTKSRYGAPLEAVDFAGAPEAQRLRINGWVAKKTKDRIQDLVPKPGVTSDTRLALVNALYFKAAWREPFNENATEKASFAAPGGKVDVPMMGHTKTMRYAEVDGVKLAEKSYKNRDYATLFVLPAKADGLEELEGKLDAALLDSWTSAIQHQRVKMKLPRFEVKPGDAFELKDALSKMGMPTAFTGKADFTGITHPKNAADQLRIEKVFHKAFVAMNEKGTEAAAATAVMMGRKGAAPGEPAEFIADRPFLFFVRDTKTGLVLFAGRVLDPSK